MYAHTCLHIRTKNSNAQARKAIPRSLSVALSHSLALSLSLSGLDPDEIWEARLKRQMERDAAADMQLGLPKKEKKSKKEKKDGKKEKKDRKNEKKEKKEKKEKRESKKKLEGG